MSLDQRLLKNTFSHYKFPTRFKLSHIKNSLILDACLHLDFRIRHKKTIKEEEQMPIFCLTSLHDGNFASGSKGTIRIRDQNTYECIYILEDYTNNDNIVTRLISLPNGVIASGLLYNTIKVWIIRTTITATTH
jgi:WD40 repeat protein